MAEKDYTDTEIALKCIDKNEALYDTEEKYLRRLKSCQIKLPEASTAEVLKNIDKCQQALLMCLKQRVIENESTVRFSPRNDLEGMQRQLHDLRLSDETRSSLCEMSGVGYQCLKDEQLFDLLVQFDAERLGKVFAFDKTVKMAAQFDMLALIDDNKIPVVDKKRVKEVAKRRNRGKQESNQISGVKAELDEKDHCVAEEEQSVSEATYSSKSLGRAAITVVLTGRNQIPALDLYRQLLFSYVHTLSKFYVLAFHVGPLVETQEIVFYEYSVPKPLVMWIKKVKRGEHVTCKTEKMESQPLEPIFEVSLTVRKTKVLGSIHELGERSKVTCLDIGELEAKFRAIKGRQLQQLSPLRDYFRYLVTDCPGVRDHLADKKSVYERSILKKEEKKRRKRKEKEERKLKEGQPITDLPGGIILGTDNTQQESSALIHRCLISYVEKGNRTGKEGRKFKERLFITDLQQEINNLATDNTPESSASINRCLINYVEQ